MWRARTWVAVGLAGFAAGEVRAGGMTGFVKSGTGGTGGGGRPARGHAGRDKIVVMQGGYHGAQESTLVEGDAEHTMPSSPGIPPSFADYTIPVPFNDTGAIEDVFEAHGDEIAAVLTEPILANTGIVHPIDGYLERLRELTEAHDALLIFDEVITGFRVGGLQCAQGKFGVTPDVTTFGKIVGGGFPGGAIGGRAEIIREFTPSGEVFQSGTFSGHPVTMAAGYEYLTYAAEHDVYDHVNRLADRLRRGITDILADRAPSYTVVGTDSMFKTVFTRRGAPVDGNSQGDALDVCAGGCRQRESCAKYDHCPKTGADVGDSEVERWERIFWQELKDRGIFLTATQFESQFVSYAHPDEDIEGTLEAYKDIV